MNLKLIIAQEGPHRAETAEGVKFKTLRALQAMMVDDMEGSSTMRSYNLSHFPQQLFTCIA